MAKLDQVVGQLLIVGFDGKVVTEEVKELIHKYRVGGFVLFSRNIGTPEELLQLTTDLQREAKEAGYDSPLLICLDQENGVVRRIGDGVTVFPGSMALGATTNPENAYKVSYATGKELKALGINWNLSPVVDVNNNPDNPVIGVRSFGESPEMVAQFGEAAMKGMQDAGIMTTLKHFPGHGDTNTDSHLDLPVIDHDIARLETVELKPFQQSIEAGADVVMTAHVYFPSIEPEAGVPATLSRKVVTGLLREKMGYDNVIITDCLEMNAISEGVGTEQGAVLALRAGADMVMISHTLSRQIGAFEKITEAIQSGELEINQIEQSIQRTSELKKKYVSWEDLQLDEHPVVPEIVGASEHFELAKNIYRESVTIVKNNDVLPLKIDKEEKILVVYPKTNATMMVEDKKFASVPIEAAVEEYHDQVDFYQISNELTNDELDEIIQKSAQYRAIIVGTLTVQIVDQLNEYINQMSKSDVPIIVIAMRSPYDWNVISQNISAYLCTYEFTYPALEMAVGAIFGKEEVTGKLPVTLKEV